MSKCCKECVFYVPPDQGFSCGTCDYPVPEYLKITSSGAFIGYPTVSGADCAVFKSKAEIASDELTKGNPHE